MEPSPSPLPRHRSPALNAAIVGFIVLAFVVAGALIWTAWSRGSLTAVDEAHEAIVQPAQVPDPADGAGPATPPPQ